MRTPEFEGALYNVKNPRKMPMTQLRRRSGVDTTLGRVRPDTDDVDEPSMRFRRSPGKILA